MFLFIKDSMDKEKANAIAIHTHAPAKKPQRDTETFITATKKPWSSANSIPSATPRPADTMQMPRKTIYRADMRQIKKAHGQSRTTNKSTNNSATGRPASISGP